MFGCWPWLSFPLCLLPALKACGWVPYPNQRGHNTPTHHCTVRHSSSNKRSALLRCKWKLRGLVNKRQEREEERKITCLFLKDSPIFKTYFFICSSWRHNLLLGIIIENTGICKVFCVNFLFFFFPHNYVDDPDTLLVSQYYDHKKLKSLSTFKFFLTLQQTILTLLS